MTKTERSFITTLKGWMKKAAEMQKRAEKITDPGARVEAKMYLQQIKTEINKIKIKG